MAPESSGSTSSCSAPQCVPTCTTLCAPKSAPSVHRSALVRARSCSRPASALARLPQILFDSSKAKRRRRANQEFKSLEFLIELRVGLSAISIGSGRGQTSDASSNGQLGQSQFQTACICGSFLCSADLCVLCASHAVPAG